jgi:hypothetical protein
MNLAFTPWVAFSLFVVPHALALGGDMARLTVSSNVIGASVYLDSVEIGTTPLQGFLIGEGEHTVCVSEVGFSWNPRLECRTIVAEAGEEVDLVIQLPRQISVQSDPFGASVILRDSVIGFTPLVFSTTAKEGSLTLVKQGFEHLHLVFDSSTALLVGNLRNERGVGKVPGSLYLETDDAKSTSWVILAGSSAVLAGAASAYFKIQADNLHREYLGNRDAATLARVRNLDTVSAIALGLSQASVGALVYLLLSQ